MSVRLKVEAQGSGALAFSDDEDGREPVVGPEVCVHRRRHRVVVRPSRAAAAAAAIRTFGALDDEKVKQPELALKVAEGAAVARRARVPADGRRVDVRAVVRRLDEVEVAADEVALADRKEEARKVALVLAHDRVVGRAAPRTVGAVPPLRPGGEEKEAAEEQEGAQHVTSRWSRLGAVGRRERPKGALGLGGANNFYDRLQ